MQIPMSRDIACQLYVYFMLHPDRSSTEVQYDEGIVIFNQSEEENENNNRRH